MEIEGASSNRVLAERLTHSNRTRRRILDQVGDSRVEPRESAAPRRRSSRGIIEQVLREEGAPLRYIDVLARVQTIDESVKPSTVKDALARLAANDRSDVERVGWGLYEVRNTQAGDDVTSGSARIVSSVHDAGVEGMGSLGER